MNKFGVVFQINSYRVYVVRQLSRGSISMASANIPFNKPFMTGREAGLINDAHSRGKLSGDGHYTKLCSEWMHSTFGTPKVLLTHSCTGD